MESRKMCKMWVWTAPAWSDCMSTLPKNTLEMELKITIFLIILRRLQRRAKVAAKGRPWGATVAAKECPWGAKEEPRGIKRMPRNPIPPTTLGPGGKT